MPCGVPGGTLRDHGRGGRSEGLRKPFLRAQHWSPRLGEHGNISINHTHAVALSSARRHRKGLAGEKDSCEGSQNNTGTLPGSLTDTAHGHRRSTKTSIMSELPRPVQSPQRWKAAPNKAGGRHGLERRQEEQKANTELLQRRLHCPQVPILV